MDLFRIIKSCIKKYKSLLNIDGSVPVYDSEIDIIKNGQPQYWVLNNIYKTHYPKNALLSYIIYPFIDDDPKNHSNYQESLVISKILSELEYNVDVINWNNDLFEPSKKYDLIIDNHNNLYRLGNYFDEYSLKIFHATNAFWLYQNSVEYYRAQYFFGKYGKLIMPTRLITPGSSAIYSDAISMFGNEFTRDTYGKYASKVYHLPMSVTTELDLLNHREFKKAKTKFLWLNSHGALLKGLDVVIDCFIQLPELELHVCCNTEADAAFIDAMANQLSESSNIIFEGWVNVSSPQFKLLSDECAWIINTSFCEGGGGSTLNCMGKGLIPLISRSASITLPEQTGFYVEQNDSESLTHLLKRVSKLPEETLKMMSGNAIDFIRANHTLENFRVMYKKFLLRIINLKNIS